MSEPDACILHKQTFGNRLLTWWLATRPAFLTASIFPVIAGLALSWHLQQSIAPLLAILSVAAIAFLHAGANVLNDYFDALNGSDAINQERVYPFTGGSRFIQNHILSLEETRRLGFLLTTIGIVLGLNLWLSTGHGLLIIGLIGGFGAIFYSAPPCLVCRGLGDIVVALCFGLLPVIGVVYTQMLQIPPQAVGLGVSIGFFVAAILWANSIPDIKADLVAGKKTLPARLGKHKATFCLPILFFLGFFTLLISPLPPGSKIALLATIPALFASLQLLQKKTEKALPLIILTHTLFCLLFISGILFLS